MKASRSHKRRDKVKKNGLGHSRSAAQIKKLVELSYDSEIDSDDLERHLESAKNSTFSRKNNNVNKKEKQMHLQMPAIPESRFHSQMRSPKVTIFHAKSKSNSVTPRIPSGVRSPYLKQDPTHFVENLDVEPMLIDHDPHTPYTPHSINTPKMQTARRIVQ